VPKSERKKWGNLKKPTFQFAGQYFAGYMPKIFKEIAARDEANRIAEFKLQRHRDSMKVYEGLDTEGKMMVDDSLLGAHLLAADYRTIARTMDETTARLVDDETRIRPLYDRIRLEDMRAEQHLEEAMKDFSDSLVRSDIAYQHVSDSLLAVQAVHQARIDSLFKARRDSIQAARKNQPDSASVSAETKKEPVKEHIGFFQRIRNFFYNLFHRKPKAGKHAAMKAAKAVVKSKADSVKAAADTVKPAVMNK
jgi:hypothetical protein